MNKAVVKNLKIKQNNNISKLLTLPSFNNYIILIIIALVISIVISAFFWTKSVSYNVLYNNLSDEDQGSIIAELTQMNIPYRLNDKSGTVLVPENIIYKLRLNLAKNGFPKGSGVGFELLDKQGFGISQFNEQINYQRALEGELSRTIQKLDVVKSARVHLGSFPSIFFLDKKKELSVGIVLELQHGRTLEFGQIQSIVHLVSSSVENLNIKNISIIDQYGHLLNQSGSEFNELNNVKFRYCKELENSYSRKIEEILLPLFGPENVHAQVTAQIDFNTKERTEEKYNPNFLDKEQSIRSHQQSFNNEPIASDVTSTDDLSNSSNSISKSVLNKENIIKHTTDVLKRKSNNVKNHFINNEKKNYFNYDKKSSVHYEDTINYELNRTVFHSKLNKGEIKRLSVAVIVNYFKDLDGKFVPLRSSQLDQINRLVKEVIGYSKDRGDTITVVNSLFFVPPVVVSKYIQKTPNYFFSSQLLRFITFVFLIVCFIFCIGWFVLLKINKRLNNNLLHKSTKQENFNKVNKEKNKNFENKTNKTCIDNTCQYDKNKSFQEIEEICNYDSQVLKKIIRYWINKQS